MGRRLDAWRALSWHARAVLVLCAAGLTGIHASLALFGYVRTRRWLEAITQRHTRRAASSTELESARQLARLAAIAGRHGAVEATCLRQSLLVHARLRWLGLDPVLQLGIRPDGGPFRAHAWVELEGEHLLEADARHVVFRVLPP